MRRWRPLLARARAARLRTVEGIDSYEGKLRQRIYIGLTALRFRRERGLFEHERIANIRWTSDGRRVIQWTGVRTAIPIAGLDTGRPGGAEPMLTLGDTSFVGVRANQQLERDMADDLLDETDMPGFDFDPGGDRLDCPDRQRHGKRLHAGGSRYPATCHPATSRYVRG